LTLIAAILLAALTKAEIIDRFKAAPVTQLDGLVQVYGDCPADMRRDFQLPVASFASDVCRRLYAAGNRKPVKFREAGIIIRIGDVRTNLTDVVARPATRDGGEKFTRIYLPSPSGADLRKFRHEIVRAFYRAVDGIDLDDEGVTKKLRESDPVTRVEDIQSEVAAWRERGEYAAGKTDEDYLKLMRGVHLPGVATKADVMTFASRLFLYPELHSAPFCGRYRSCSFRDAIALVLEDPTVRLAAYLKIQPLMLFGQGHGDRMNGAVEAYAKFLAELARCKLPREDLVKLLDDADEKLKGALEE
jgi:hypothetical protein